MRHRDLGASEAVEDRQLALACLASVAENLAAGVAAGTLPDPSSDRAFVKLLRIALVRLSWTFGRLCF